MKKLLDSILSGLVAGGAFIADSVAAYPLGERDLYEPMAGAKGAQGGSTKSETMGRLCSGEGIALR